MRRNRRSPEFQRLNEGGHPPLRLGPCIRSTWPTILLAFITIFFGVLIIIWNEAKAVAAAKAMQESSETIIKIDVEKEISSEMVGKLVYLTGGIEIHEPVTDPEYGISILAVKLKRRVQMYQWVEEETELPETGDPPTSQFFYFTDWRDKIIDSTHFDNSAGHRNPKYFPIKTQIILNDKITLGKYELGRELKERFNLYEEITGDERPENKDVKLHAGLYYHTQDIWNPEVGDLRIQFSYAGINGEEISVVGKIDSEGRIVAFKTNLGVNILLMSSGEASAEELFSQDHFHRQFLTWGYRLVGWFFLYIGSLCLSKVFNVLCQQSGSFIELVPSFPMTMSVSMYLLVTGFSWVWYKPPLGLGLLIAIIIIVYFSGFLGDRHPDFERAERAERMAQAAELSRLTRSFRAPRNFGFPNIHQNRQNRYNRL